MEKSEIEQKFLSLVDSYKQVIYKVCFMYATDALREALQAL